MYTGQTSRSQYLSNFVDNLVWCLTGYTKDWVDVWIVSAALVSDPASKLLDIYLSVSISVEFIEKSCQFVIIKHTTNGLKGLFELVRTNSSVTFQVEVFEKSFGCFSFVICAVSSLTNLFKNDGLNLSKSRSRDNRSIRV